MKKCIAVVIVGILFMAITPVFAEAAEPQQRFRHIVVWDFKQGLSEEEKVTLFDRMKGDLEALVTVIDGIVELRVERDTINPGLNGEGQIVLLGLFESREAHAAYVPHPRHVEIAAYVVADIVENRRAANFYE